MIDFALAPALVDARRIARAHAHIDRSLLESPMLELEIAGRRIALKNESGNRLGCFKGRGADWYVQDSLQPAYVCASAGNFGLALADAAARRGGRAVVFVASGANPYKVARIRAAGAEVIVAGDDFDAAKDAARAHARRHGLPMVEDGAITEIAEGAGTIAIELLRDARCDAVYVPVGNGALAAGVGAWIRAHAPLTAVIGVASAGARVMHDVWHAHRSADVEAARRAIRSAQSHTLADGIAVRVPVPAAVAALDQVLDDFVVVDDAALVAAQSLVAARTGLAVELSAVAGLAAILALASGADHGDGAAATIVTGANVAR